MSDIPRYAPSPPVVGALLITVSIGVGVAAGWLISLAAWAILAACLLTAATVGMALGVLWTLRRSWSDKRWPPAGQELPADVRARRALRNLGIVLLAPSPIAVAGLAWVIADGSFRWERVLLFALFVMAYGTAGVWLLRASRFHPAAVTQRESHVQRPPDRAQPDEAHG